MPRRLRTIVPLLLIITWFLAFVPATSLRSQEDVRRVFVTNLPQTQQVAGTVAIDGVVRHATLQRLKDLLVSPVSPKETTRLVPAVTLTTDGFTSVVLSLNGQTKGRALRAGSVGALLIPDEETVIRAFEEEGLFQFPMEIKAPSVSGASLYFASEPQRFTVGFPRYRVLLYNTTDKTANVSLHAYLTN